MTDDTSKITRFQRMENATDPLCADCAEWREEHEKSRDADQRGLGEWEDQ